MLVMLDHLAYDMLENREPGLLNIIIPLAIKLTRCFNKCRAPKIVEAWLNVKMVATMTHSTLSDLP